jgi:hypothetical protein
MNRKIGSVFTALALAFVMIPARPANAKITVSIFRLHDHSLIADFEDASDDGCFVTQTNVRFTESVTQIGGPPIIGPPTTQIDLFYANACTLEFFELTGGTTTQTFHIANDLSSATLVATVPVTDVNGTGNNATVNVNVKWIANAPTQQVKNTTITRDANTITVDSINFQTRAALVQGPLTTVLNVQGGPTTFDLARFPEDGQLGKDAEGTRTVTFIHGH